MSKNTLKHSPVRSETSAGLCHLNVFFCISEIKEQQTTKCKYNNIQVCAI
jgi:hypothetical protein